MKRLACAFVLSLFAVLASAAPLWRDTPHLLPWTPYANGDYTIAAALDDNDFPVVLYDPLGLADIPDQLALLFLLREELIAIEVSKRVDDGTLTRALLRGKARSLGSSSTGRFAVISEEYAYKTTAVTRLESTGLNEAGRLTCLAYRAMSPKDRYAALNQYESLVATGKRFAFGESMRGRDLRRDMGRCMSQ